MFRGFNLRSSSIRRTGWKCRPRPHLRLRVARRLPVHRRGTSAERDRRGRTGAAATQGKVARQGLLRPEAEAAVAAVPASRRPRRQRQRRGDSRHDRTLRPALAADGTRRPPEPRAGRRRGGRRSPRRVRMLNQLHTTSELPLDAIVIGRGGGSTEDLWAFNEEVVATRSSSRWCRSCRPSGTRSTSRSPIWSPITAPRRRRRRSRR